jgi:hypothetical protein
LGKSANINAKGSKYLQTFAGGPKEGQRSLHFKNMLGTYEDGRASSSLGWLEG